VKFLSFKVGSRDSLISPCRRSLFGRLVSPFTSLSVLVKFLCKFCLSLVVLAFFRRDKNVDIYNYAVLINSNSTAHINCVKRGKRFCRNSKLKSNPYPCNQKQDVLRCLITIHKAFISLYQYDFELYGLFLDFRNIKRKSHYGIFTLAMGWSGYRMPAVPIFSAPAQTGSGAHPASCTMVLVVFHGGKAAGAWL
jgi:hypothetical protein